MYTIKNLGDKNKRIAAGQAIVRLSQSVFKAGVGRAESEWQVFDRDPAAWLYANGYRLLDHPQSPANGAILPNLVRILPVYDTPTTMHLRIPHIGNIDTTITPPNGDEYGDSFDDFLASYFTRQCR
jgi:hypothetical protein